MTKIPAWAAPSIESFHHSGSLPGDTVRTNLGAEQANGYRQDLRDQYDALAALDNGPEDRDSAPGRVTVSFPELQSRFDVEYSGNSMAGTLAVAGEPDVAFSMRFVAPKAAESVAVVESTPAPSAVAMFMEATGGYLLATAPDVPQLPGG